MLLNNFHTNNLIRCCFCTVIFLQSNYKHLYKPCMSYFIMFVLLHVLCPCSVKNVWNLNKFCFFVVMRINLS